MRKSILLNIPFVIMMILALVMILQFEPATDELLIGIAVIVTPILWVMSITWNMFKEVDGETGCPYGFCDESHEWIESLSDTLEKQFRLRCDASFKCTDCGSVLDSTSNFVHEEDGALYVACPNCGGYPECIEYELSE